MESSHIKCELFETEQPQSPNLNGGEVNKENGSTQDNARKRHFEKVLFGDIGISPRKAARKGSEEDDQYTKMVDFSIVERDTERLREYRAALAERLVNAGEIVTGQSNIKSHFDNLNLQSFKTEQITNDVGCSGATIDDGSNNGTKDDEIKDNGSCNGSNEDEKYDDGSTNGTNDNDRIDDGDGDNEKLVKEHELPNSEVGSAKENEIRLHRKIDSLQMKLIDTDIELINEKIKFTENLANTQVMVVVESKAPAHDNSEQLQFVLLKLREVADSCSMLREYVTQVPKLMLPVVEDAMMQMQSEIQAVGEKKYQELLEKYTSEIQLRKHYQNQLMELRGNIRVFCRVKPCKAADGLSETVMNFDPFDDGIIVVNNKGRCQRFQVDKLFNMDASQSQVFDEVSTFVRAAIDGFNVCIFAYGQTGSGKTHTMEGVPNDPGVNQRALHLLYEEMKTSNWQYSVEISMLEIYNEALIDLLNPDQHTKNLEVKMRPEGGFHVPGLMTVPVDSVQEVNKIFETGSRNRAKASTGMNEKSSRSHCLLCVSVTGVNLTTGSKTFGRLNLVDLAGSERVSRSQAEGVRLLEAKNINKSLSCLGDVINALKNKHAHVPYRNSKLTYLLQESLGGNSKTLMILQVSPEEDDLNESICTLSFGQRVQSAELGTAKRKIEEANTPKSTPVRCPIADLINSPMVGPSVKITPITSKASPLFSKVQRLK